MSMYGLFKTSVDLESGGVIIDYGSFRVTIARAGGYNKRFAKALEAITKPYRRAMQTETMDNDIAIELLYKVYADTVIIKWETKVDDEWKIGIEQPDDEDLLPVNAENIIKTFTQLPDLFLDIREQSNRIAIFREEILENDSGNSPSS